MQSIVLSNVVDLVSNETVLRQWKSEELKSVINHKVNKVNLPP